VGKLVQGPLRNYHKAPSDFDTAKWNIEHTLQLRRLRIASLEPYLLL